MKRIYCTRPQHLEPKSIGCSFVFNFFGPRCGLAVITMEGSIYEAFESERGLTVRTLDGATMNKGPVFRFLERHLEALKAGETPSKLSSMQARRTSTHQVGNVQLPQSEVTA